MKNATCPSPHPSLPSGCTLRVILSKACTLGSSSQRVSPLKVDIVLYSQKFWVYTLRVILSKVVSPLQVDIVCYSQIEFPLGVYSPRVFLSKVWFRTQGRHCAIRFALKVAFSHSQKRSSSLQGVQTDCVRVQGFISFLGLFWV